MTHGAPAKVFKLDCPPCESHLKGDRKPQVLKYKLDPKTGTPSGPPQRVPDSDPMWSSTPETVPMTPDQEATHHLRIERGEQQLRALESIATLAKANVDFRSRPDVLFFLRENQLPEDILQGSVLCANGHDNPSGLKFCGECGMSMAAKGAIGAPAPEPEAAPIDLTVLHPQSLKKLARERGLSDKGSKDELIKRLKAA